MRIQPQITRLLVSCVATVAVAADASQVWAQAAQHATPRLVVVLAVDQMRADYAHTYGHHWTAGLKRLANDGAWYEQATYPYRATLTCAGHATIATGTFPARHGMVKNTWWDRARGASVTCTTDERETPVSYGGHATERHSPASVERPTLADVLRTDTTTRARVVALSLKPRSAITLAGRQADAVVWFDAGDTWATSTAYTKAPVAAVREFVAATPVEGTQGEVWERSLPKDAYLHSDDGVGEQPPRGWTNTFPHAFGDNADGGFYQRWRASPFSDRYLTDMALALVDAFELGQGQRTDYLGIGYSALDYVGHRFGPRSHEVQDTLARLDRALGDLFAALDETVGRGGYVVALSADHGVSPIPEVAVSDGVDAGRTGWSALQAELDALLTERYGTGPAVVSVDGGDIYFATGVYERLRRNADDLEAVVTHVKRAPGVWRVYRSERLPNALTDDDPVTRAVALSYFPGRSGDLIMIPKPYWIGRGYAASHGSPYRYDTHVPVVLYGAGVVAGRYDLPATPADIAPTLASLTGVSLPDPDGRVLREALTRD